MYFEVATKFRNFENCRFVFSQYDNACIRCDLYCRERIFLASMTVEGPVLPDRMCLYVRNKAMTEDFVTELFKMNIVTACKKVIIDDMDTYCCVLKRNLAFSQQRAVAFA